jgi:hypothetical protein
MGQFAASQPGGARLDDGAFRSILAFQVRPRGGWLWLLFGGIAIVLGIMIWEQLPSSVPGVLRLLLGINLVFSGLTFLMLSATEPSAATATALTHQTRIAGGVELMRYTYATACAKLSERPRSRPIRRQVSPWQCMDSARSRRGYRSCFRKSRKKGGPEQRLALVDARGPGFSARGANAVQGVRTWAFLLGLRRRPSPVRNRRLAGSRRWRRQLELMAEACGGCAAAFEGCA